MSDNKHSRREFVGLTGAGVAGVVAGVAGDRWLGAGQATQGTADARDPDVVVYNANVVTVDDRAPRAEAFAVKDGRFLAVGSTDDVRNLAGRATLLVNAEGMTVVPGFIDCHNHARGNTLLTSTLVGNPYEVEFVTIDSIVEKLRKKAAETPPDQWVEGTFFDDTKLKDGRALNIHDLDKVSTSLPVVVRHRGGHTSYYNSKAFEMARINKDSPAPAGGTIDHFDNGELNGRVTDRATSIFNGVGKRPTFTPEEEMERDRKGLSFISQQFVRYGLTSVHHEGGNLLALQQIRAAGDLLHRVSFEVSGDLLDSMITNGIMSDFGDPWLKLGATSEHTVDGSFSERTMSMSTPYPGSNPPYEGNVTTTQEDLNAWVERAHRAGIQVNCHANGDVAIDMALTAYERAQRMFPQADHRPKITHCTLVNADLVRRIKAVGAVPAPFTTYAYYNSDKFHFYGEETMKHCMAFRDFLDAGIPVAAGSDFSPGPFAPLMGMQGMVTRTGWNGETWGANQRVSVEEALRINTLNGAHASYEEDLKGSITQGKLADYVVLAEDVLTVDSEHIKDIKIVRTVVGGSTSYEA